MHVSAISISIFKTFNPVISFVEVEKTCTEFLFPDENFHFNPIDLQVIFKAYKIIKGLLTTYIKACCFEAFTILIGVFENFY